MSIPEFRVRPVIRHVVTRYTRPEQLPPGVHTDVAHKASLETLGEFDSDAYAEIVAEALRDRVAPREFVIVECTFGETTARVTYAYSEQEALERKAERQAVDDKTYRVYSRIKEPMPV